MIMIFIDIISSYFLIKLNLKNDPFSHNFNSLSHNYISMGISFLF